MSDKTDILRCPRCGGRFRFSSENAACVDCGAEYSEMGSILDLRLGRHDYYFNPVPRDRMRELTGKIENGDWVDVIGGFLEEVNYNPDWVDNLLAAGRYSWKLFLDLPVDAVILDLGCGLGNLSQSLSKNVAHLYAMDLTLERLEFTDQRLKKFAPDRSVNLLAGGDSDRLPFADGSFDLVCLSGVLEWVPDVDGLWRHSGSKLQRLMKMVSVNIGNDNPKKMQIRFLREIARILKPGGQIFVAIENRHNYQYFAGRPDHHSGLPYGALLPRWAANLYSIWRNRRPYRTYTHGRRGYQGLMSSAGYGQPEFIGLYPGYSHLKELRPFGFSRYCEEAPTDRQLSTRFKRSQATSPAYGIVAYKEPPAGGPGEKLADRLIDNIFQTVGIKDSGYCLARVFVSPKEKTVMKVQADRLSLAVRMPWESDTAEQELINHHWLRYFENRELTTVRLPKPLAEGSYQGIRFFAESWIDAKNDVLRREDVDDSMVFGKAMSALNELRAYGEIGSVSLTGDAYRRLVETPLKNIEAVVGADVSASIAQSVSASTEGRSIRTGIRHGDFSVSNFLGVMDSTVPALIDWEFGEDKGIMGLDEISFFASLGRRLGYFESTIDCLIEIFEGMNGEFGRAFRDAVAESLNGAGNGGAPDETDWMCLGKLFWLDHVDKQLHGSNRFNKKWVRDNVDAFTRL